MALKTIEQYYQSLEDLHPTAYILGEKVDNVYEHPLIKHMTAAIARTYSLAQETEGSQYLVTRSDLTDEEVMQPFIDTVTRHNLVLLTHASEPVGHDYAGKGSITPDILYYLITSFPDLTLICAHWGGGLPFYALMPEVKEAMSNVYFDTAASPFLYRPQVYNQVVHLVGADKILFGSDYPLMSPSRLLREIETLDLPAETEHLILGGNAQKLLGLLGIN